MYEIFLSRGTFLRIGRFTFTINDRSIYFDDFSDLTHKEEKKFKRHLKERTLKLYDPRGQRMFDLPKIKIEETVEDDTEYKEEIKVLEDNIIVVPANELEDLTEEVMDGTIKEIKKKLEEHDNIELIKACLLHEQVNRNRKTLISHLEEILESA